MLTDQDVPVITCMYTVWPCTQITYMALDWSIRQIKTTLLSKISWNLCFQVNWLDNWGKLLGINDSFVGVRLLASEPWLAQCVPVTQPCRLTITVTVTLFSSILDSHYLLSHLLSHFCQYISMLNVCGWKCSKLLDYARIMLNAHAMHNACFSASPIAMPRPRSSLTREYLPCSPVRGEHVPKFAYTCIFASLLKLLNALNKITC